MKRENQTTRMIALEVNHKNYVLSKGQNELKCSKNYKTFCIQYVMVVCSMTKSPTDETIPFFDKHKNEHFKL